MLECTCQWVMCPQGRCQVCARVISARLSVTDSGARRTVRDAGHSMALNTNRTVLHMIGPALLGRPFVTLTFYLNVSPKQVSTGHWCEQLEETFSQLLSLGGHVPFPSCWSQLTGAQAPKDVSRRACRTVMSPLVRDSTPIPRGCTNPSLPALVSMTGSPETFIILRKSHIFFINFHSL